MDLRRFRTGDTLLLQDGARVEVLAPTEDSQRIKVRYVEAPREPSLVGEEALVPDYAVAAFFPSPPGPEWGDRVIVVVHHVPESDEGEEGYEAVTMGGVPIGVSIAASDCDTGQEAIDRILGALSIFGFAGKVVVEDATYVGGTQRYEIEVQ